MTASTNADLVRALCEAARLPVSEQDLEALAPLYELISAGLNHLALIVEDGDTSPLRFAP